MVKFFNRDEQGIEGVVGAAGQAAKSAVKKTTDQVDVTTQDVVNQLYGSTDSSAEESNKDQGTEAVTKAAGQAKKSQKGQANIRNPAGQQALLRSSGATGGQAILERQQRLLKKMTPEEVEKFEKLRKLLHDEQVRDVIEGRKEQPEERVADKLAREEEEKKVKKQEKQFVEVKKKEDLAVAQKKTSVENKGWGAG